MNQSLFLCLVSFIPLVGCGGPFGKWEVTEGPFVEHFKAVADRQYETVTKNGVQYQIERSSGHPAIGWAVGPNRLGAIMNDVADSIDYQTIHTLEGNRYVFMRECEGIATRGGDKYSGPTEDAVTFRIFEYADKQTMFIFRDVDMSGRKFRTYIVVASKQRPTGNYSHWIHQRTNALTKVAYCLDVKRLSSGGGGATAACNDDQWLSTLGYHHE